MSDGGHPGFRGLQGFKIGYLRFMFSSYPNEIKSITISLWAVDSDGTEFHRTQGEVLTYDMLLGPV